MAVCVNTAVKALKPPAAYPVRDASLAQARVRQLRSSHDPPLPPRKLGESGLELAPSSLR